MYTRLDGDGLLFLLKLLWSDIEKRPELTSLADVAISGSYNDLTDLPDIPEVSTVIASTSTNTTAASSLAVYTFVTNAIKDLTSFHAEIVSQLPATGQGNVMYLVPKSTSAEGNIYDEYLWIDNKFELVGTTAIDLSGYVQASEMHALTNQEITTIYNNAKGDT